MPISPIGGIERREVHLLDRVDHEPRQVIPRQPVPHIRRQQKALLTTRFDEVLWHDSMVLNPPDGTTLCDSLVGDARVLDTVTFPSADYCILTNARVSVGHGESPRTCSTLRSWRSRMLGRPTGRTARSCARGLSAAAP